MSAAVKHQPATPLPWEAYCTASPSRNAVMQGGCIFAELHGSDYRRDRPDAKYIAHTANAYPKLVDALRAVAKGNKDALTVTAETGVLDDLGEQADALLRELGEAS